MCMPLLVAAHVESVSPGLGEQVSIIAHGATGSAVQSQSFPKHGHKDEAMIQRCQGKHPTSCSQHCGHYLSDTKTWFTLDVEAPLSAC